LSLAPKTRAADRKELIQLLGGKCGHCGYDKDNRALCIDHVNGGGKADLKYGPRKYRRLIEFIEAGSKEYQLLCANCNQIKREENNENKNRKYQAPLPQSATGSSL
jgi:hypothetical protein